MYIYIYIYIYTYIYIYITEYIRDTCVRCEAARDLDDTNIRVRREIPNIRVRLNMSQTSAEYSETSAEYSQTSAERASMRTLGYMFLNCCRVRRPSVGERGSAPKGGRHSTTCANPRGKLC